MTNKVRTYSGIGSRSASLGICQTFIAIAQKLAEQGYVLRSGGASGCDEAFESGCDLAAGQKEIYLPWKGFNDNLSQIYKVGEDAKELASTIHPAWDACNFAARKLHGRNCYQVLGLDLNTPSEFVVCWTPAGTVGGGTATAINLAIAKGVQVYNFAVLQQEREFYARRLV